MKIFTPPFAIILFCSFFFSTKALNAQHTCDDFDIQLETIGVYCGKYRGAIKVDIIGGKSGKYIIEWDNENNSVWDKTSTFFTFYTIEDLKPGEYTVKVMDYRTRCFAMKKIRLIPNALPKDLEMVSHPAKCNGYGSLSVNMMKQNDPVYMKVRGPKSANYIAHSTKFKIYNLPAGDYEIDFVKDDCVATTTFSIDEMEGLPKLKLEAERDNCQNHTGSVKVTLPDVAGPFNLSWKGAATGIIENISNTSIHDLPTGAYTFTLENSEGCKSFTMIEIDNAALAVDLTSIQSTCSENGAIALDISAGVAPYTIEWTGAGEGSELINEKQTTLSLPKGTYIVYVTDANGCKTYASTTIVEKENDLYCTMTPTATTCGLDNGSIDVFISGGVAPYTLSYEGPINGEVMVNGSTVISNLPVGTYTTYLKDAEGCIVSESSTIDFTLAIEVVAGFTYSSNGTTVSFSNTSSYGSYSWDFGDGNTSTESSPQHTFVQAGSYEVCLTVEGDCNTDQVCEMIQFSTSNNLIEDKANIKANITNNVLNVEPIKLLQNSPNPFSNKTQITFQLPKAAATTIRIQNHLGSLIYETTAEYEKGENQFIFHKGNLSTGVYYYSIHTGNYTVTRKMIIQ